MVKQDSQSWRIALILLRSFEPSRNQQRRRQHEIRVSCPMLSKQSQIFASTLGTAFTFFTNRPGLVRASSQSQGGDFTKTLNYRPITKVSRKIFRMKYMVTSCMETQSPEQGRFCGDAKPDCHYERVDCSKSRPKEAKISSFSG